ncbi:MAG: class I SAM-dependent methyltransferase, partial [Hyphomicrobiales bacterium]
IKAVDFLPPFLERLQDRAKSRSVGGRIETLEASMDALPFADGQFDAIWSEGAIYNVGFETGVRAWRRFLKPGGVLAVSEITWLTSERPQDLERHWTREYPGIATASAKLAILEAAGYAPAGYFPLPETCWLDSYYRPMQARFAEFLARNGNSDAARAIVAAEETEIALYERYAAFYGYGFYIAKKTVA